MSPTLMRSVRQLLASEAEDVASSTEIARGLTSACERISNRLAPIVGDAGIRALYDRSLALTRTKFPWLRDPASAEQQPPEIANEAAIALLASFIDLLERLIGHGLTSRLLRDVWPDAFSEPPKEPK